MQIRELDLKELYEVYQVLKELYQDLSYQEFEDLIYDMRDTNYKMIGIIEDNIVVCYAGINISTNLQNGRYLNISELVTDIKYRDKGYAKMMLDYIVDYAKMGMCETILVSISSKKCLEFYQKLNFSKRYNRVHYHSLKD